MQSALHQTRRHLHRLARTLLLISLWCSESGVADDMITLNMRNADIGAVVQWLADTTGKRVIMDPRVTGQLTILARDPMTPADAYRVVVSALAVYGYSAIERDDTLTIVPQANTKTGATRIADTLSDSEADVPLNQVVRLSNLPADKVAETLRPLVPEHGALVALPESNSLLITDTAGNVRRIVRLAQQLDRNASLELDVVSLEHASADELADALQQLLGEDQTVQLQISTDKRVNAIVLAGSADMRARAQELIRRLDQPEAAQGSMRVVYLHYLKAAELLPVLRGMEPTEDKKLSRPVAIEASESANALIISAPPDRLEAMLAVVEKLDIRRAQVLVEAIIAEVDDDVSRTLGIEWKSAFDGDGVEAISRFSDGEVQVPDSPLSDVARGLTLGYFRNGSLRGLVQALQLDKDSNILSTPSIVTLDNQEAEILVGSNVPLITGQATSSGAPTENPFTTIERKDIGITLKVTPQINQGDAITLDILQTVETLTDSQVAEDIVTDKRSLHTVVMLQDEDVLVLGGLIQDQATQSVEKVPLLGDIPLLGKLFSKSTKGFVKKNLMVFVRTRILTDIAAAEDETRERYSRMRDLQSAQDKRGHDSRLLKESPVLPPLQEKEQAVESTTSEAIPSAAVEAPPIAPQPADAP
jgi:general secretion pathway protein D